MLINCKFCGKQTDKPAGHINRSRRLGRPLYCGRVCARSDRPDKARITEKFCPKCNEILPISAYQLVNHFIKRTGKTCSYYDRWCKTCTNSSRRVGKRKLPSQKKCKQCGVLKPNDLINFGARNVKYEVTSKVYNLTHHLCRDCLNKQQSLRRQNLDPSYIKEMLKRDKKVDNYNDKVKKILNNRIKKVIRQL